MNNKLYLVGLVLIVSSWSYAQNGSKINFFKLNEVQLLSSPFSQAMELDKKYLLELNADRLLAPYLKEAALQPKAENYPNWENTGLDGHIGGHYLSALALMFAQSGDKEIEKRLDYMLSEMERCQMANGNGYLAGIPNGKIIWEEISKGNIRANNFGLNDRWVPLYNIHKTYAGLRDAYLHAGKEKAKIMLIKLTDWMLWEVSSLKDNQIQEMLRSEHGGLNEVFADVYQITGENKYLELAKKFSHNEILEPLIEHQDKLTGMHANTQIPKVIGFKRIADLDHNQNWESAVTFFWKNVTEERSVSIGGNSIGEHFNPIDDFSNMVRNVEGPETCNTYNMLKLTKELYSTSPNSSYINYYERALYNHILSSQNNEKGGFVYFTPMRPGHYRVYSQPHTSFWCCVGSGMENHAKYGEMIYASAKDILYVNLFIASKLNWKDKKTTIIQENSFPETPQTRLLINPKKSIFFSLKLRCPDWTDAAQVKILLNSKLVKINKDEMGYFTITRKWHKGDVVSLQFPMHLSVEPLPDQSAYYSFRYGPIVLAAEFGKENLQGLFADDSRGGHIAHGTQLPLNAMPVILGPSQNLLSHLRSLEGKPLHFHMDGLYPDVYASGFNLIPFYKIQDSRYILYWPQADADKVIEMQKKKAEEEQQVQKLNKISIDKITLGEQQPESDHFIEFKDAYTGYKEDHHYRDASGWFSYRMFNKVRSARYLYITYFNADPNRLLNIDINGKNVISKILDGKSANTVEYLIVPIPQSEYDSENIKIKFNAPENGFTAKITELRLLNKELKW